MTHPNADLFAELAERAKTKSDPFEGLQYRIDSDDSWRLWNPSITNVMPLEYGWEWQFKPESVTVEVWVVVGGNADRMATFNRDEAMAYVARYGGLALHMSDTYTPEGGSAVSDTQDWKDRALQAAGNAAQWRFRAETAEARVAELEAWQQQALSILSRYQFIAAAPTLQEDA